MLFRIIKSYLRKKAEDRDLNFDAELSKQIQDKKFNYKSLKQRIDNYGKPKQKALLAIMVARSAGKESSRFG